MARQNRTPTQSVERAAKQAAAHPWFERLARFGMAAKGVVYAVVGVLAARVAFGAGGRTTDSQGALVTIINQPFGQILLSLIAIGLVGYVLWRFVQAFLDPENKGSDGEGIAKRGGDFINGLIYGSLAFTAIKMLLGAAKNSNQNSPQDWTARILTQPFGQWLVGVGGAFIIGYGFYEFYKAYKAKFRQEFKWHEMSEAERKWTTRAGRLGFFARGIVFLIIGFFLIQAARLSDPSQARGLGGALETLAQQPYGPWLLGIVAIGLLAYGIFTIVQARYKRIITS